MSLGSHLTLFQVVRSGSFTVMNSHLRGALTVMRERRAKRGPVNSFLERVSQPCLALLAKQS